MKSGIYKIKNLKNSKYYLGSAVDMFTRRNKHFSDLSQNKHHSIVLQRAYNKYGRKNLKFEVIVFCDKYSLKLLEQQFLDNYPCHYNSSKYASGYKIGRKLSKEINKKRIENMKKAVIQYDKNMNFIKRWNSSKDIVEELGIYSSGISETCNGRRKTYKGFIFKFEDNFIPYNRKSEATMSKEQAFKNRRKASEKEYLIIYPNGMKELISNLRKFCKENNLNEKCMYNVSAGFKKSYKKIKVKPINRKS